ncbi:MAG TPA: DUF6491 family protein [Allosphingosinicella sp.]|jgi:NAD(P)H-flavin reductase|nr:DUF6491 family protein [Allosphingosinicella sp.]
MRTFLAPALLSLACASAAAAEGAPEIRIPFINSMTNVEWKAASDDSLYLRGPRGDWYFVRTANRCTRLLVARGIGFQTHAGQLDRNGAIMVQGVRCPVESIARSEGPPARPRRKAG